MNCPPRTALALLPLLAVSLLPLRSAQAASSCAGFIPATITTAANLITAVQQAQSLNCPGADTIDLGGNTITLTTASFVDAGVPLGLPAITTPLTLTNGTITRGGATSFRFLVTNTGGTLTLDNLTLSNGGGAGFIDGGAVRVGDGTLTVTGATFLNNNASNSGGAVVINGTGAATFTNAVFQGNQAGQFGGAIAIASGSTGTVSIQRTRFLGNDSSYRGGAVSQATTNTVQIGDTLFAGNSASGGGAALYLMAGTQTVHGTTIAGNRGSAVEIDVGAATTLRNSLIWGNSGGSFAGTPITLTYTAAEGYAGANLNTGYTVEDFFVAPLSTPTAASTGLNYNATLYDWHLRPFAPAIDAAANSAASVADIEGNVRRVDDTHVTDSGNGTTPVVDMGAYERQSSSCASFAYPYTLAGGSNTIRRLNLRDAVRCANFNATDDTIDLIGQTVTYDSAFALADGVQTALPAITSAMTLRNGTIERAAAGGTPNFRLLANTSGTLTLSGLTLRNGNAGSASAANRGGALSNLGTLTIRQSTLAGNTAHTAGALYSTTGPAVIERSTFSGNVAVAGASAIWSNGQLTLSNSTVSGNSVTTAATGAVTGDSGSTLSLISSTIVDNTNTTTTASAGLNSAGTTSLYNSILANNAPYDCARSTGLIVFSAGTSNIVETQPAATPCGVAGSNLLAVDPQLGTPTGTPAWYPLTPASPAIDAGDATSLGGATLDQAGNARVQGLTADLGSYESPFVAQQRSVAFDAANSSADEAAGLGNIVRVRTSDGAVTAATITVTVNVTGGTATAADYVRTGTLTIPAGTADNALVSIASAITVTDDTVVEGHESLQLSLQAPSGATLGPQATTTHVIRNDDTATLTIADASIAEGNSGTSTLTFTVTLSNAVQGGAVVDYASTGLTATTADNDFVAAAGSLSFAGNSGETQTFSVTVNGDTKLEANETLQVSLPSATGAMAPGSLIITDTAIGTITNDDAAAVTIADASVSEGDAGTTQLTFTATLDNAVQGGVTVNYATVNGSATTADNDYVAATGTLTFTGTAGETRTFNVTVNGDTRVEANETFTVALNTASNAAVNITDTATGTLVNDDTARVTIADVSVAEGNAGTRNLIFTAILDNAVPGGFTVNYTTVNGMATTADGDYTAASGTLTFTGAAGQSRTFVILVNGDTKLEADETFTVALNTVSNAAVDISDTATGTITNDDAAAVTIADVSVSEGNAGSTAMTFTATLGNAVQGGFTVNYATVNGTATMADNDYAAATGTLTFAGTAGETRTFSVTVIGDTKVEPDETFAVTLNTVSNAAVAITDTATGTITNDDAAAVTITDASVSEGNAGTTPMTFTATLDNAVQGSFTVKYATANGTATIADNDYAAAGGTLAFAGTAGETQTFTVTVNGDIRFEPDETFTVAMNSSSNPAVAVVDTATGTIANDDTAAGFIVTPASVQTSEAGASATFTVALAAQPGATVTLPLSSSDTGEGTVSPATLSFDAANWNSAQLVTVTGVDDAIVDGTVAYSIILGAASSTDPAFDGLDPADVAASNTDNDVAGIRVTPTALTVAEGGAGASYTVVLDSEPVGGSVTVTVASDSQITATPPTLLFTAANWNIAQTVTVGAVDDALAEGSHSSTITHSVSGADYGSVSATGVTVTISDNDTAGIVVTPTTGLVTSEAGGTATFTLALSSEPTADVSIALSSSDTGEGSVAPATLTFTAANWNSAQTVTVNGVDDAIVDGDVAYTVVTAPATSADPRYAGIDAADVAVTNRDDDGASLRINDVSLAEGDSGTTAFVFSVTLDGDVTGGVRVNYATADDTALAAADYAAASGTLTFAGTRGETQMITVAVTGDTLVEGDERFRVVLSGADPAVVVLSRAEGVGTITDDDASAQLAAAKRVTQAGTPTRPAIYQIVVTNTGTAVQADAAASDELVDVLPSGLALQSASASSGTVVADTAGNTVRWNGALAAGAAVTIEIRAAVVATIAGPVSNRAQVNYDSDGDGSNDASALSDDPTTPGDDATVFLFVPAGVTAPTPVPLLGPWALLGLALGVAWLAAGALRRRNAPAAKTMAAT